MSQVGSVYIYTVNVEIDITLQVCRSKDTFTMLMASNIHLFYLG